jgi:DNA-directed RNA polymerase sigma subunit (sigma70/sigma32)
MPADKVEELLKLGQEPVSLEAPIGSGDDPAQLADFIEDEADERPVAQVAKAIRESDVQDVLEGLPDHRDSVLSKSEREANKSMMICVGGCKSERLVLDL